MKDFLKGASSATGSASIAAMVASIGGGWEAYQHRNWGVLFACVSAFFGAVGSLTAKHETKVALSNHVDATSPSPEGQR